MPFPNLNDLIEQYKKINLPYSENSLRRFGQSKTKILTKLPVRKD